MVCNVVVSEEGKKLRANVEQLIYVVFHIEVMYTLLDLYVIDLEVKNLKRN